MNRIFLAVLLLSAACVGGRSRGIESVDVFPTLKQGLVNYQEGEARPDPATLKALTDQLRALITMVDQKDWTNLPSMVSRKKGIYVDLKGYRTFAQMEADIKDHNSYLYVFYHDTPRLRKETDDARQVAVRDVLRRAGIVEVDFFMEQGGHECELKLNLRETPKESYRLNHPVFIFEEGQWKVFRLF